MSRHRHEASDVAPAKLAQAAKTDSAKTEFEAIFGTAEQDTLISATSETVALLNGVFAPSQTPVDTSTVWSLFSFG